MRIGAYNQTVYTKAADGSFACVVAQDHSPRTMLTRVWALQRGSRCLAQGSQLASRPALRAESPRIGTSVRRRECANARGSEYDVTAAALRPLAAAGERYHILAGGGYDQVRQRVQRTLPADASN